MKEKYPEKYRDRPVETPNIFLRAWFKVKATFLAVKHPYILKFLGFLVL